jgi:serine/threonine protein kinase
MNDDSTDSELEAFEELCERQRDGLEASAAIEAVVPDHLRSLGSVVARLERSRRGIAVTEIPTTLGPYRLVSELGRGGMGRVFEAREEGLDRRVAVKVLPGSGLGGGQTRERFLREARAIARLHHPGIVPIHAVGEQDGWLYYAMDLIEGASLADLVSRVEGSETTGERARWVARVGVQAAEALGHAHRNGVIHRDVKPSNLLMDADGRVWLADFGLAKLVDEPSLTASGDWLGTLRYLAPETLQGEADPRSDLYSLGLTLHELLVGSPAYPESDRARLVGQIVKADPTPPRSIDPTIPESLERIILKAMAREPDDRYADMRTLADDLRRFLANETVQASGPGWLSRGMRGARRNPLLSALVVLTLALAVAVTWLLFRAVETPPTTRAPAPSAVPGPSFERGKGPPPWAAGRSRGQGQGKGGRGMGRGPNGQP